MSDPVIWWITTGQAGFRSQAQGLAHALGFDAQEKVIGLKPPWAWAPAGLWRLTLAKLDPSKDTLSPPWPDLVISCSRRAGMVAAAIKKASGGRTLAVHIQNPLTALNQFDLVIPMRHDGVRGPNVMSVDLALHDVAPAKLADAAHAWRKRFTHLPRPLTGVLLGGSTKRHPFTIEHGRTLIERLNVARQKGGLAITASRRTPDAVKALLRDAYADDPGVFLWDGEGDNPYFGILALSDRLAVTGDSVSMVSEAAASGRPVAVFDLGGGARHQRFLGNLIERGVVGRLDGSPWPLAPEGPVNATPDAAEAVLALLQARTGRVG